MEFQSYKVIHDLFSGDQWELFVIIKPVSIYTVIFFFLLANLPTLFSEERGGGWQEFILCFWLLLSYHHGIEALGQI